MNWKEPDIFETGIHRNKPFGICVPSLVVTRSENDRLNLLAATWFTPAGLGADICSAVASLWTRRDSYDLRKNTLSLCPTNTSESRHRFGARMGCPSSKIHLRDAQEAQT
jgi:hypothetical protein